MKLINETSFNLVARTLENNIKSNFIAIEKDLRDPVNFLYTFSYLVWTYKAKDFKLLN
jgi:hypothetical protein